MKFSSELIHSWDSLSSASLIQLCLCSIYLYLQRFSKVNFLWVHMWSHSSLTTRISNSWPLKILKENCCWSCSEDLWVQKKIHLPFFFPLCMWCVCEFARVHLVGIELMDTRHFWCWVWTRDFPVRCFLELKLQESVTLSDYISRSPVVYIKITSFHLFYFSYYIREVNNFPLL